MVLKLYEPKEKGSLFLPDNVDKTKDDSAVFIIIDIGPGTPDHPMKGKVGDIVMLEGALSVFTVKLPNGEKVVVGKNRDVAFILEEEDLV
jgi:hypothetical protein